AAEQLLPLVYDELRRLAAERMAQERPGQTLQATALVHEAYLRLVDVKEVQHWNSRGRTRSRVEGDSRSGAATTEGGVSAGSARANSTSECRSRRPTRARQRPLFLRVMSTYSSNARKPPRRKEGISPTPAPLWLQNLTTRCPLRFDCPPGETSR